MYCIGSIGGLGSGARLKFHKGDSKAMDLILALSLLLVTTILSVWVYLFAPSKRA